MSTPPPPLFGRLTDSSVSGVFREPPPLPLLKGKLPIVFTGPNPFPHPPHFYLWFFVLFFVFCWDWRSVPFDSLFEWEGLVGFPHAEPLPGLSPSFFFRHLRSYFSLPWNWHVRVKLFFNGRRCGYRFFCLYLQPISIRRGLLLFDGFSSRESGISPPQVKWQRLQ